MHFRPKPKKQILPLTSLSIHLKNLTSFLRIRTIVKWLKLFAPLSWNMNYLSQLSGGSNHPIPPFSNHPSIHRSTPVRGDFRRAVKSLARQGRLEESELRRSAFVGRFRRGRTVGTGEVVGDTGLWGRFLFFWRGVKFFFLGGVGWVKFFLGGLVGWLILSCCGGWLKRLADRWLSFQRVVCFMFQLKKFGKMNPCWRIFETVLNSSPMFLHVFLNMIYQCHCVDLHLSSCGGSVLSKVEQAYVSL